jgi:hypothetical protein
MLRHAEHLATLAEKTCSEVPERLRFISQRLLCRKPTSEEEKAWSDYAHKHGLANLCRVLLNSSEFLFID